MSDKPKAEPIRPIINDVNRAFWDGCRRGELLLQRCSHCGRMRYPAGAVCPDCLAVEAQWQPVSGCGKVFSFVVFHRAYHPAWEGRVPYNVALIELDEGPRLVGQVLECAIDDVRCGMPVEVVFEDLTERVTLPQWRPVRS